MYLDSKHYLFRVKGVGLGLIIRVSGICFGIGASHWARGE